MDHHRTKQVGLALQGGGAHGAFTWGVLDRLLEDERIEVAAISGTSAGAMNAVVLADGLVAGGRDGAREALRRFWSRVSNAAGNAALRPDAMAAFLGGWSIDGSPLRCYLDWISRSLSPNLFNPLDLNPLRDIVAAEVDFGRVRACDKVRLFVSATNVRTGQLKEFRQAELSPDVVMASACLPMVFRTVEIGGEAYWDGGYLGNPSLLTLVAESAAHDIVLVQINPTWHEALPTTPQHILDRLDEIIFNSSLLKDLRALALIQQLVRQEGEPRGPGRLPLYAQIAQLRMHRIDAETRLEALGVDSKTNTSWPFLTRLHRIGHQAAQDWLDANFGHLGRRSTLALKPFLG
jgi:NTE family protein